MPTNNSSSNYKIIAKLENYAKAVSEEAIIDFLGETLSKNIKKEARRMLKRGNGEYPYEYWGDIEREETTYYDKNNRIVVVDHPAANRIEFGLKTDLTITPKNGDKLSFMGRQGEQVVVSSVTIKAVNNKGIGFVAKAIRDTRKEFKQKYKGVLKSRLLNLETGNYEVVR